MTTLSNPQAKGVITVDGIPTKDTRLILGGSLKVPPLCIGTWAWGDSTWDYKEEMVKDIEETWDTLEDLGVDFFDTAEVYGHGESELNIGRLLKRSHERRQAKSAQATTATATTTDASDDTVSASTTKAGDDDDYPKPIVATKFLPYPWRLNYPTCLLNSLKGSMERLGVDSIDYYQIHGPIHLRSIEVVGEALAEAVKQGLVKAVGVSNYSTAELERMHATLAKHGIQLAANQIEFSLLRRLPETSGHIAKCHELGVAVLSYSSLGMGRLTGKYSEANPPPGKRRFSNYPMKQLTPLLAVIERIAKEQDTTMSAVALNWVICKGALPIVGARTPDQARQNVKCLGWRLTEQQIADLDKEALIGNNSLFWQHA
ncbi:hypothetical protein DFQ26_009887 [Actinomortierella ambigua]|nr:hypothetical protein DFQ26_009887 [Actinomortierella ambigua]